jgi:hypothetical protein
MDDMNQDKTAQSFDLDAKQHPADSFRQSFAEVVMLPVLREQIRVISNWMEINGNIAVEAHA